MNKLKAIFLFTCLLICIQFSFAQGSKVEIKRSAIGTYTFIKDGQPYYVKGVGGDAFMDKAQEIGANSIRLWGAENAQSVLDEAQKRGLSVMLGLWMAPERHGFDYSDAIACKDQLEQFRSVVRKYKNHPALLLWGVGNEVDLEYTDFSVWQAVQNIAAMIHQEDGYHPTCVVTAGIDVAEVKLISQTCPDIDILGVNTYGDLPALAEKIRLFGWNKPYMVTEWGPNGHWEVAKTAWAAPIEQSSTQKADCYKERYFKHILNDSGLCIGSYVFLWGQKQETTPTWYGMFVNNKASGAVNVLEEAWTGHATSYPVPRIERFTINGKKPEESVYLSKSGKASIQFVLQSNEAASLIYHWEIMPESEFTKSGGDAEQKPEAMQVKIKQTPDGYQFVAPFQSGAYRLFVYITDTHNQITTANFPFYVK